MTILEDFRGGKRIDPRPRKQTRKLDASCSLSGPQSSWPTTLQLNIEGLTASKICVVSQLAFRHKALVILLQETHCTNADRLVIPNFTLAGWVSSRIHGLATFVHERLKWTIADQSLEGSAIEWLCVDVDGCNIVNIYKPPNSQLTPMAIPVFQYPCLYAGDFNCWHTDWGYDSITPDGERLADWAAQGNLVLLYSSKDPPSFFSGRWNTGTNPDLVFASAGHDSLSLDRRILEKFPRSQHRPSLITSTKLVASVPSAPYKRWNFRKANWERYSLITDKLAKDLPPPDTSYTDEAYQDFYCIILRAAKRSIPRGRRNNYRPCWDAECNRLYQAFVKASPGKASNKAASALLAQLDEKRKQRWSEAVNTIDFTHSSRLAWNTINNLTGRSRNTTRPCPISANSIASQLVKNGTYETRDRESARLVAKEVSDLWRIPTPAGKSISGDFTPEEFSCALQQLKPGKAPGPDSICPELILHAGAALKSWLNKFLSSCMRHLKLPKIWRRATVVAIPKPKKPVGDPRSYRPISLLCIPFKILERLIYARVEPIIDPLLPQEQAGFRRGRSTTDQVTLLTQEIEDSFSANKKAGAVFVDLTAAYDILWHRGLTCKLLRLLPDRHMVSMIMELVRNRSFTLTTGNGPQSRLRRLKNGVPQGSVLAPLLFNIYISDLPGTIAKKFAYADDLAILHSASNWQTLEESLNQDMSTLSSYLRKWKLKLSTTKTVSAAFHLNNREARRELSINTEGRALPYCAEPTYLGIKLDRSLTFRRHLESLRKKLTTRVGLLRRLAGSGWGAGATTLRTAALALVHSAAEYCAPVWCRSAHTRLIDKPINDALRIVTGCLRPTPIDNLFVLAGILPTELRRKKAVLSLARRAQGPESILHERLLSLPYGGNRQLKSRHPFVPAALKLLDEFSKSDTSVACWAESIWNTEWQDSTSRLRDYIPSTSPTPPGMLLPRPSWVKLNRLRTGVGLFRSTMHKWGMAAKATCECGAEEQTADHIISSCPIYHHPNGARGLVSIDESTEAWLADGCPSI